jgi:predicted nucleic acid-binding OB-fold protein
LATLWQTKDSFGKRKVLQAMGLQHFALLSLLLKKYPEPIQNREKIGKQKKQKALIYRPLQFWCFPLFSARCTIFVN